VFPIPNEVHPVTNRTTPNRSPWGKVLEHMDASAAATATAMDNVKQSTADSAAAMNAASKSLTTLAKDQDRSLHRLEQMDRTLQASLQQTNTMASALQTQLEILQKEQADRLAVLARKPKLVLYWGDDLSV
jgi:septal ring factor EnvC (AmiA/AmiB activator)